MRFDEQWVDPILDGKKTLTYRFGLAAGDAEERSVGEQVMASFYGPKGPEDFALIEIVDTDVVYLRNVSREDAQRAGHANLTAFVDYMETKAKGARLPIVEIGDAILHKIEFELVRRA